MHLQTIFTLRVVYKNGYTHDFDVTSFNVKGGNWSWDCADYINRPVLLGVDEIAAVWQIGQRKKLVFFGSKQ